MNRLWGPLQVAVAGMLLAGSVAAADIPVGNLVDYTGNTAVVGREYGQGKVDAAAYINAHGGIAGRMLALDTVDYSYRVPQAIAAYKGWARKRIPAIQGWGTGDTEALVGFVANDHIPFFSASYSGHLTDPTGKGPKTTKPAPYNFFVGPSYSDGVRGLLQWAKADWEAKGAPGTPKYVHMGDNHPYPNAPKPAGEEYARELGFEVLPAIQYGQAPTDFKAQCLSLKESGAHYAFLGNTSGANISLLKSCATVGVETRFMANIWGYDENVMNAAGTAANGVVWVMGAAAWGADVPGMKQVEAVSRMSDPSGEAYRVVHYIRGICSMFYMKEAMAWADRNGGITGPNIKEGMYQKSDWVPEGLDGVCPPATWTREDHRGVTRVFVYEGRVEGGDGTSSMAKVFEADVPRKPEWLGW